MLNLFTPVRIYRFERPRRPGAASIYIEQLEPLCRELQDSGNKGFLIFIDASETTNLELLKLYATHFNFYADDRVAFIRTIFALIPKFVILNTFVKHSSYNTNWKLPPAIKIGAKVETDAPEKLSRLGLKPFKYVILTHRSHSYDQKYLNSNYLGIDRHTDIGKAENAVRMIHEKGLKTVRIGVDTDELPDSLKNLPIIDLSGEFRTDEQDLWLAEHCMFLWAINDSGVWHFAHKYNRPTLVTNTYALIRGYQHTLFTFQLISDEDKNRILTIAEMLAFRRVVGKISEMKSHGLTFIENSQSELVTSVAEMLNFANGELENNEKDQSLLSQFNETLVNAGYPSVYEGHSRPSVSFLRNHKTKLF